VRRAALALVLALALVAAGCGGSKKSSSKGGVKEGGTLRLGTSSRIDSLNPFVAFNQDAYTTFMYIYPFLVQYDRNLHFAPDFATKWETSQDGKTWTFHTRPNAKWSDGKPLTAADAAFTINTDVAYQKTTAANAAGLVAHITKATAPDANTLVVHYEALAIIDSSPFGLLAAVFTQDLRRGLRFAEAARAGWVNINESTNYWESHLPFGGRAGSQSGIGRVGGRFSMETFTELKTVVVNLG